MTFAIDSAVALKWFIPEPYHDDARRLLDRPDALIAPDTLLAECAEALRHKLRLDEIGEADARRILASLSAGVPGLRPAPPLVPRGLEIAQALARPVADGLFVALAEAEGCRLVTADHRLLDRLLISPWAELARWVEDTSP